MVFYNIVSGCDWIIASTNLVFGDFGDMVFNIICGNRSWVTTSDSNLAFRNIINEKEISSR